MELSTQIRALLGDDGPIARRLAGFERRREQEDMARAVAEALEAGEPLVAEAGTGVGKSFAYLLPASLWADATGQQVVVSTRTKALQEQLATKDLPFLQAVLPIELTWAVAVGRSNYLCLRRMHQAVHDRVMLFQDDERVEQLDRIASWAAAGPDRGVRSELPFVPDPSVWEEVEAEQGNCLGPECRHYAPCHWQRGRRTMQTARVLVVNHALYFADLALRRAGVAYLPEHACVVFDEAHHVESIASHQLGLRFSPAQLEWLLSRLKSHNGQRGLLVRLGLPEEARLVDELRRRAVEYWERPAALLAAAGDGQLRLTDEQTIDDTLSEPLERLGLALAHVARRFEREPALELTSRSARLLETAALARALAAPAGDNDVRWLERGRRSVVVRSAPIRITDTLREWLFDRVPRVVLTSATLGPPEHGFEWLRSRLGMTGTRAVRVGSPFDYEHNVQLVLDQSLPDPGRQPREFENEASERVRELCVQNGGRALVLCTSWRFLHRCRDVLEPACERAGLPLLVQGDRPLPQLIDEKQRVPESILLGTDSLWEGIDIPGDAVTLLILTRFPFPVPSHPLLAARGEDLERRGRSSFHELSLPLAVLKFKQGFGRLVRSASDRGRVVVLDPRVLRRDYGRRFLDVLPECRGDSSLAPGDRHEP